MDFDQFDENDFIGGCILDNDIEEFQRLLPNIMPHELYYFACCENGRFEMLQMLPSNYMLLDSNNRNLLHYACENGHEDIAYHLINVEPQLGTSSDNNGDYPFHLACEGDHIKIAMYLIDIFPQMLHMEPNPNSGSCLNAVLLHPITEESLVLIKQIVSNNPVLLHVPRYTQYPLFQLFSIEQNWHLRNVCLQLFLEYNCPVGLKDDSNKNILSYVIKLNNAELTVAFINRGVNINEQDNHGNSPLHDYYHAATSSLYVERDFAYIPTVINWSLTNKNGESVEKLKNLAVSINHSLGTKRRRNYENLTNKKPVQ